MLHYLLPAYRKFYVSVRKDRHSMCQGNSHCLTPINTLDKIQKFCQLKNVVCVVTAHALNVYKEFAEKQLQCAVKLCGLCCQSMLLQLIHTLPWIHAEFMQKAPGKLKDQDSDNSIIKYQLKNKNEILTFIHNDGTKC